MELSEVIKVATEFVESVRAVYPDADYYLFGSHAKDTARPTSDIDVAIIVDELPNDPWETFYKDGLIWQKAAETGAPIEPTVVPWNEPSGLVGNILSTGIKLSDHAD